MHPNQVNFRQLKERISIQQVLSHYGWRLQPAGLGNLRGPCPLPTHTSRSSTDSFSVQLGRNVWSCHSASCRAARQGRLGGNVLDLVAALERCSLRQAGMHLQNWFGAAGSGLAPAPRTPAALTLPTNSPLRFRLHNIDCQHPYLTQRGISPDTAHLFGVGLYRGPGFLAGRLVIPIHDPGGQLIAYAGRSLTGEPPKYRFPTGFRKSQVLFNFHRAIHAGANRAILVEGFFDALQLHQAGHRNVVALMGSIFSRRQSDLLTRHFQSLILLLDGDPAGRHAADLITQSLQSKMSVHRIDLPDGRQPDQMRPAEIRALLA
jgi:5S rRNA maturation endonuclease (ribonuclease M5)